MAVARATGEKLDDPITERTNHQGAAVWAVAGRLRNGVVDRRRNIETCLESRGRQEEEAPSRTLA